MTLSRRVRKVHVTNDKGGGGGGQNVRQVPYCLHSGQAKATLETASKTSWGKIEYCSEITLDSPSSKLGGLWQVIQY